MVQGLGPGFFTVATRRSVILSVDGLEFVLTFRICGSAVAYFCKSAPPNRAADLLRSPRRLIPLGRTISSCLLFSTVFLVMLSVAAGKLVTLPLRKRRRKPYPHNRRRLDIDCECLLCGHNQAHVRARDKSSLYISSAPIPA